jgi:hypothetical protein
MNDSVANTLADEMARVSNEVLLEYMKMGQAGAVTLTSIRLDLRAASRAMADDDVAGMVTAYESLKRYTK